MKLGTQSQAHRVLTLNKLLTNMAAQLEADKPNEPSRRTGGRPKLTDEAVATIRASPATAKQLASLYGVTELYITKIRTGEARPVMSAGRINQRRKT